MGKTAFVQTTAYNAATELGKNVAFFSLEMSAKKFAMRYCKMFPELKLSDRFNEATRRFCGAEKPFEDVPIFIDETPALSIDEFQKKAYSLKIHQNIDIIIVDYLQLMMGTYETRGNREMEVDSIVRALKAMAMKLDIPIIATSHLNRSLEARTGKRPRLSDFRESSAIEEDSDIIAFIHRPEYFGFTEDDMGEPVKELAEIIVAKNRNGETGTAKLRFQKELAKFSNFENND